MKCQICDSDKITMRAHPKEKHKPLYHTSIYIDGARVQEIDIIFCGAKCSLEYYENKRV